MASEAARQQPPKFRHVPAIGALLSLWWSHDLGTIVNVLINYNLSAAAFLVARMRQPALKHVGVVSMVLLVSEFRPDSCVVAEVKASPNHGERKGGAKPDMIVLHYTGMRDAKLALEHLCSPLSEVSAHYVVMEDGHIVQCVPESRRAWHAGVSSWAGETDINSCSIGIEIANPGHDYGYPDFPRRQTAAMIALCRSILTRHRIPANRVLGHSDVAPSRKKDPGEKFPWRLLHDSGIGLWVKPAPITAAGGRIFVLGDRRPRGEDAADVVATPGLRHRDHRQL